MLGWRTLWLEHFYGREGYRGDLRRAVKGLLHVLAASYRALGETHRLIRKIEDTLHSALTEQLDWSLDDLELDADEKESLENFSRHCF